MPVLILRAARQYNIRLIVKGTGHDYIGRSVAPNSLSIWTRHMTGTTLHPSEFQPKGCQNMLEVPAITALAGTPTIDIVTAAAAVNQTIVCGGAGNIGMGGYLTGGGHGMLSARYGLAADQVLEMEVVTPSGDLVTANAYQNQDLFWAMRGVCPILSSTCLYPFHVLASRLHGCTNGGTIPGRWFHIRRHDLRNDENLPQSSPRLAPVQHCHFQLH